MVFPFGFTFREFLWLERVFGPIGAGKRRQDVEAVRAEVGEDSLFKSPVRAPQMFQVLVCVKGLEFAVGQSCSFLEQVAACTEEYFSRFDESGKRFTW